MQAFWIAHDGTAIVWIPIKAQGQAPSARFHHTANLFDGEACNSHVSKHNISPLFQSCQVGLVCVKTSKVHAVNKLIAQVCLFKKLQCACQLGHAEATVQHSPRTPAAAASLAYAVMKKSHCMGYMSKSQSCASHA